METHRLKGECPPERRNFKAQWPILVFNNRLHKRQRRGTKGTGETKAPKLSARQKKSMRNRKEYVKRTLAAKESFLALAKEARAKLGPALAKFLRNGKKSLTPLAADPSNVTDKEAMLFQRAQVVNKFLELQIESNNEKRLVNQRACAIFDVSAYLVASWTRHFCGRNPARFKRPRPHTGRQWLRCLWRAEAR